jgi:cell division protein FtsZ
MITYPRWIERSGATPILRLIGIGNAGVNIADRIAMRSSLPLETVAINSDLHSLKASVASKKYSLGPLTTHGLGAGGDPERGFDAAKESEADLQRAVEGADTVFLCAGLGGGTGGPASVLLAEMAHKNGSLVIAVVTTPFQFEGRRRTRQAQESLRELGQFADAILHFENDRMCELTAPRAEATETFAACDDLLFQSVAALTRLMTSCGPLPIAFPDLLNVLHVSSGSCLFGCGEAAGANRAHEALEQALRSPLLDRGRLLHDAEKILVHLAGPASLTFVEVAAIMQEISKATAATAILYTGISTSAEESAPLIVTLVGHCGASPKTESQPRIPALEPAPVQGTPPFISCEGAPAPAAPIVPKNEAPLPEPPQIKAVVQKVKQEDLPLEPIARGRFEKIEPTIVEGEDLDIPTFLRLKIKK